MWALVYDEPSNTLQVEPDHPEPVPGPNEALIQVLRSGVCSTDLEITRGYVPGFKYVLGHEFVGRVLQCPNKPELVGCRVVGEINCNDANFRCADAIFQRNHAEGRSVLGIIGRDGCHAERVCLPASNLHVVPDGVSDQEACFAEPLAAACRLVEQGLLKSGSKVAVIGDGKLGLLVAQVMGRQAAASEGCDVTMFGRHEVKMNMVNASGVKARILMSEDVGTKFAAAFDLVVEASGTSSGIMTALAITRPLGTVVLKTTVSLNDPNMPAWSAIANDIVINEKLLVGSRCGPMDAAVSLLEEGSVRELVDKMTSAIHSIQDGMKAIEHAKQKGVLKVQISYA